MKISPETSNFTSNDLDYKNFYAKAVVVFFKLFGLAPVTIVVKSVKISKNVSNTSKSIQFVYSVFGCFYNLSLIALMIGMNYLATPLLLDTDYAYKSNITVTFEIFGSIAATVGVLIVLILYCVRQTTMVNLLNRFVTIDRKIYDLVDDRFTKSNRYYFGGLIIGNSLIWISTIIGFRLCSNTSILNIFNNLVPGAIMNCLMMQYIVTIKLIEIRFKSLNSALLENADKTSIDQSISLLLIPESVTTENRNFPKIIEFRRAHFLLYEITADFATFYSLPITFAIALGCYVVIYNSYYTALIFVLRAFEFEGICNRHLLIFNSVIWTITMLLPITLLAVGVDRITDQMRYTADVVAKLLSKTITNQDEKSELEEFSLELVQRNVTFDACGLFTLDCTLVHSIFSMVAMYLVILMQFQLGN